VLGQGYQGSTIYQNIFVQGWKCCDYVVWFCLLFLNYKLLKMVKAKTKITKSCGFGHFVITKCTIKACEIASNKTHWH